MISSVGRSLRKPGPSQCKKALEIPEQPGLDLLRNRPDNQFELDAAIRASLGKPGWHSHPLRASTFAAFSCFDHLRHVQLSQQFSSRSKQGSGHRPKWDSTPYFPSRRRRSLQPSPTSRQPVRPGNGNPSDPDTRNPSLTRKAWNNDTTLPAAERVKSLFAPKAASQSQTARPLHILRHKSRTQTALSSGRPQP